MKNLRRALLVLVLTIGTAACSGSILGPEHSPDGGNHSPDGGNVVAHSPDGGN